MRKEELKKALKGSIKKWKAIVKSTKAIDEGTYNCPLCQLFYDCSGCIVMEAVGDDGCRKTPYAEWRYHQEKVHLCEFDDWHRVKGCKTCLSLTKKELKFLESLKKKLDEE